MNFNPYQPPTSASDGAYSYASPSGGVSDRAIAALRKTRPWVLFIAVLLFVFCGFTLLASLGMLMESPGEGVGFMVGAAIYVVPAISLVRYAGAINKLLHGGGQAELDQSIEAQASFWQIAGIYTLIGIVLMVLAMVAAVASFNAF